MGRPKAHAHVAGLAPADAKSEAGGQGARRGSCLYVEGLGMLGLLGGLLGLLGLLEFLNPLNLIR